MKGNRINSYGYDTLLSSFKGLMPVIMNSGQEPVPPGPEPSQKEYLTFEILEDGQLTWVLIKEYEGNIPTIEMNKTIEYSKDSGETWTSITSNDDIPPIIDVLRGDIIIFKGDNKSYAGQDENEEEEWYYYFINHFTSTCEFNVYGNIMSIIDSTNFTTITTLTEKNTFASLFAECENLIEASGLTLPATTLEESCYVSMFEGCTSLISAPVLPATTLGDTCYASMFQGCISLVNAPELPATALAYGCYLSMFQGCTSLVDAPVLPATTLADDCYSYMFQGCTSLINAPVLPATTLVDGCYNSMFKGCTSLNYIKCLATDISADYCTQNWVRSVSNSGTFVKDSSMTGWTNGNNGIPNGWSELS